MMTMADIERIESNMSDTVAPGEDCVVSEETMRELLARAKAWERVRNFDAIPSSPSVFSHKVSRLVDDFKAIAAKGFRP